MADEDRARHQAVAMVDAHLKITLLTVVAELKACQLDVASHHGEGGRAGLHEGIVALGGVERCQLRWLASRSPLSTTV